MIRAGDKVIIYEDPATRGKPEGIATLRELYSRNGNRLLWRVEFDDLPGEYYERTICGEDTDAEAAED